MDKDEFYRDILEGMALYTRSAFQRDVLKTLSRLDEPALAEALNKNQIASKLWLADALFGAVGAELGNVLVLGGWFGVLPAILLHDARFAIAKVTSLDVDPRCAGVALALNDTHVRAGKFAAVTADMVDYDYAGGANAAGAPKLVSTRAASTSRRSIAGTRESRTGSCWRCSPTIISRAASTSIACLIWRHSRSGPRCATSSSPASTSFAATCASC